MSLYRYNDFFDTKPQFELIKNNLDLQSKEIDSHGKILYL